MADGKLYIADTNNHAIRVADLATGTVTTLHLRGLAAPAAIAGFTSTSFGTEDVITVPAHSVPAGQPGQLTVQRNLPDGYYLNPLAPFTYQINVKGEGITVPAEAQRFSGPTPSLPLTIPFRAAGTHQATLDLDLTFYYCRTDNSGVCAIQSVRWNVPLQTTTDGATTAPTLSYTASPPVAQRKL